MQSHRPEPQVAPSARPYRIRMRAVRAGRAARGRLGPESLEGRDTVVGASSRATSGERQLSEQVALGARACRIRVRAARAGRTARGRPDGPGPGASRGEQQAPEDDRAARRPHPASGETREDRARRPRRELVSTVLDHARERGPTGGETDDVLTISVDVAAFDGRPTASASSRSARSTTTVARGTPGLSGTHRGREGRVGHAGGAQQRRTRARVSPRVWV